MLKTSSLRSIPRADECHGDFATNDFSKRQYNGHSENKLRMRTFDVVLDVVQFATLTILSYGVAPAMLVWGWVRWGKHPKLRTVPSILSLVGFIFATASATLAVSSLMYSHFHPDPRFAIFYPLLFNMSRCGVLISFAGVFLAW